jgi:pimeloyl-ACP methyl ester carboxylesterase
VHGGPITGKQNSAGLNHKRRGRIFRILGYVLISFVALFIASCFIFDHFVQFRMSDRELKNLFNEHKLDGQIKYYDTCGRTIRYVEIGSDTLPTLFMLHGSPSSLSIYEGYFKDTEFVKKFRMVAVDRPGYGYSGFGEPEPSIKRQADILWPALAGLGANGKRVMIIAGSYGTSIACRMLMDHPNAADGLMLVAPSLAPGEEKVYWFTNLVENPLINWFIPRMFRSANKEKISHRNELTEMLPYWDRIRVPVSYLQGANDQLIYTSNAEFARKKMVNVPWLHIEFLKDRPHFFAFSDRMIIRKKILDLYAQMEKPKHAAPVLQP